MKDVSVWKDKIKSKKTGKIKRVSVSKSSKVKPGYVLNIIIIILALKNKNKNTDSH